MNMIRVALFENLAQAQSAQQLLIEAGICAHTRAESGQAKLWFISPRRAGARLETAASDAERGEKLLREQSADPRLQPAIRCPECKSFRVDYPQFTEKSLFTNLAMGLMAELGLIERQYFCEECHCMWIRPGTKVPRSRSHLAPDYFLEDFSPSARTSSTEPNPDGAVGRLYRGLEADSKGSALSGLAGSKAMLLRRARQVMVLPLGGLLLLSYNRALIAATTPTQLPEIKSGTSRTDTKTKTYAVRQERPSALVATGPTYLRDVLPILMGKCGRCHNEQSQVLANWLDYDTASSKRWEIKRRVWDSWHGTYFKQPMPTANGPESVAITAEEREAIKAWVEEGAPRGIAPIYSGLSKSEKIENGRRLFGTICAACHQSTGQGIPGRFPPLAGSDFLNSDKHRAIKVVVNGLQGEVVVNSQHFNNAMPKFPLTDQDIASALTFVYNSFGNSGKEVSPDEVSAVRNEKEEPGSAPISTVKVPEEKSPFE